MFWNKKQGWFGKQLETNIKALNEGDFSRIPWIFCVFAEQHVISKQTAAQALEGALRNVTFDDIIRIDTQMRQTTSMEWNINWRKYKIEDFFTSKMSVAERRAIIIFASFNPNGYIREKAVVMMKVYDNTLPYIILRQNDWVVQVRQAASRSFDERLQKLNEGELLIALPYAEKLKWSSRGSHGEYTKRFFQKLTSPEHREDLKKGLQSTNVRTRRICINALLESSQSGSLLALNHLKLEPDPFLRSMLFRQLCGTKMNLNEVAMVMLRDNYSINRIIALQYLRDENEKDIWDIACTLLFDKNASVRVMAREILQERDNDFDFRSFYIAALEENNVLAIAGLGETGQAVDAHYMERYLGDERMMVVRSVLTALMSLDADKYASTTHNMLGEDRIGIVKTAQQLIMKYNVPDYDEIRNIFWSTPYEYTKIKCAAILFSASKWQRLVYMLEVLSCDSESLQRLARQAIQGWLSNFNKFFAQANMQQKEMIQGLLEKQNDKLADSIKKELLFVLR